MNQELNLFDINSELKDILKS